MSDTKEYLIEMAKLAENADRFDDMAEFMKKYVEEFEQYELTDEERNLLSVAYKNIVGSKRSSFKVLEGEIEKLKIMEEKEQSATGKIELAKGIKSTVKQELHKVCSEVISLLDKYLLKNASEPKVKVFYNKMKGDYFRYQVEVAEDINEKKQKSDMAADAYKDADEIAREHLKPTDPILLGLALNYSVFYYEIKEDHEEACNKAKHAFHTALAELDEIQDSKDTFKDTTLIMQLLRDNLTLWTSEDTQEQDDD